MLHNVCAITFIICYFKYMFDYLSSLLDSKFLVGDNAGLVPCCMSSSSTISGVNVLSKRISSINIY